MTRQEALALKEKILAYDRLYYDQGISEISDNEYDRLYKQYQDAIKEYPDLDDETSPTRRVGAEARSSGLQKFTHKSPLLSIDRKAKEISELKDFYDKLPSGTRLIVEPKFDGITCNLNYEGGVFVNAATRGNGYIGDLVTENFRNTDTRFPQKVDCDELEIRGEAIIPFDFFQKNMEEEYSNPRNAVSGIMRSLLPEDVKGNGIQVIFYDLGIVSKPLDDSDEKNLLMCKDLGFCTAPYAIAENWEDLERIVTSKLNGLIESRNGFNVLKASKDYPDAVCDGLVIKVDSARLRNEIGFSEKGPKWAFAYKFKPLQAKTHLRDVLWQVGKSGRVTPVAVFDEVMLGGTRITRATLNNYDYMTHLPFVKDGEPDLNTETALYENDPIVIERSNDVIPRVIGVDASANNLLRPHESFFREPENCPECGSQLVKVNMLHYCQNPDCPAARMGRFVHFASRDAMNIVGMGDSVVQDLFSLHLLKDLSDIYRLRQHREEILALDRWGNLKTDNLLAAIEHPRNPEIWQLIYGLSIPTVGKKLAKDLARRFQNFEELQKATLEELLSMEDVAELTAQRVLTFFRENDFTELLKEVHPKEVESTGERFKGMTFVITGTLEMPRNSYVEIIEKEGGRVANSVSKKTDYVLIGTDAGSKETKARELAAKGEPVHILDDIRTIHEFLGIG